VEKLLRQLEAQGEVVSTHRMLIPQISSKFPIEVITKFEETKRDPTIPWTMESLRGALCYYIIVHENVQRYGNNNNVYTKGQPIMYNNNVPSHARGQDYTSKQGKHGTGKLLPTTEVFHWRS